MKVSGTVVGKMGKMPKAWISEMRRPGMRRSIRRTTEKVFRASANAEIQDQLDSLNPGSFETIQAMERAEEKAVALAHQFNEILTAAMDEAWKKIRDLEAENPEANLMVEYDHYDRFFYLLPKEYRKRA